MEWFTQGLYKTTGIMLPIVTAKSPAWGARLPCAGVFSFCFALGTRVTTAGTG